MDLVTRIANEFNTSNDRAYEILRGSLYEGSWELGWRAGQTLCEVYCLIGYDGERHLHDHIVDLYGEEEDGVFCREEIDDFEDLPELISSSYSWEEIRRYVEEYLIEDLGLNKEFELEEHYAL